MSVSMQATRSLARSSLALFSITTFAAAQCGLDWQPGAPAPGPSGSVYASAMLPNGDLVVGGTFVIADGAVVNRVARWDGSEWRALGAGVDNTVRAVAVMPNGDVIVAGDLLAAGGNPASRIARWDGTTWSPLGAGVDSRVEALLALPNGDLIAGGQFTFAGGSQAPRIARWDGSTWTPLGSGMTGAVYSLARLTNGDLLAGGNMTMAGGVAVRGLARWDGVNWTAVPGLQNASIVFDIQPLPLAQFALAGSLEIAGSFGQIAVSAGAGLQLLPPPPGLHNEVGLLANGDLVAGGYTPSSSTGTVARWDGATWTSIGAGAPFRTFAFELAQNGDLIAVGQRVDGSVTTGNAVARFDGTGWTGLGANEPPEIVAMVSMSNGDVVAGGRFAAIEGVAANNIAIWNGTAWSAMGLGVDGPVRALARTANGALLVSGDFSNAGGGPASSIARWHGGAWTTLGAGLPAAAASLAGNQAGEVLALVNSQLQRFDGLTWSLLTPPGGGSPSSVVAGPGGGFVLAGVFVAAPFGITGILHFQNGLFSTTENAPSVVRTLGIDRDGMVLAAGSFGTAPLRLQGNTWSAIGPMQYPFGQIVSLASLPNGDVIAQSGPYVVASSTVLTRFDGTSWTLLATAENGGTQVVVAAGRDTGEVLLAGRFLQIDGNISAGFARASAQCPAAVSQFGAGCTGAAGALTLAADGLPWTGGTFRSTADGLTTPALALHVVGTQPVVVPLPLGAPGCSLFVDPSFLDLLLPTGSTVAAPLAIPRNIALAGQLVHTQVVALELDPTQQLQRVTSTNALVLTIGSL